MVLAPLCTINEDYFNFYRDVPGHKILDNGAAEGASVDVEELVRLAMALGVDEVVAPDTLGDMSRTIDQLEQFLPFAATLKVMVVLQASSWSEFDTIFNVAQYYKVSSVALPRVMNRALGNNARLAGAQLIRRTTDLPIHALGCTEYLREARWLARQDIVRGIDSSAPAAQGLQGRTCRDPYVQRPANFFLLGGPATDIIKENLDQFRQWCNTSS
jgi:hypothetical protein